MRFTITTLFVPITLKVTHALGANEILEPSRKFS